MSSTSSTGLASPGIGSGLDINGLVTKLMQVESQPLTLLKTKETGVQAKLSAYGTLKSALSTLQSSGFALASAATFNARTTSFSDTSVATATATTDATPGTYGIVVTNIAKNLTIRSDAAYAATSETFNTGTLTITTGTGATPITIDASNNTLTGVRDAINSANAGVSATIVDDGTSNRLVLTASSPGSDGSFTVAATDSGSGGTHALTELDYAGGAGVAGQTLRVQTADDAQLSVNGLSITRSSNTLTDVITGVTLNLAKAGSTTLTLGRDTAAVSTAVTAFVKAYNDVNKLVHDAMAYNPNTGKAAVLTGDATVRGVQSQLSRLISTSVTGLSGGISTLSDIGISVLKDGSLSTNTSTLQAALSDTTKDVAGLFSKTTYGNEGIAVRLNTVIDGFIGTSGQLTGRTDGLNDSLADIAKQRTTLQNRLEEIEDRYRKQFNALDLLMARMQSTTAYLTQQLDRLAKLSTNGK